MGRGTSNTPCEVGSGQLEPEGGNFNGTNDGVNFQTCVYMEKRANLASTARGQLHKGQRFFTKCKKNGCLKHDYLVPAFLRDPLCKGGRGLKWWQLARCGAVRTGNAPR